jgi:hypothetical protein
MAGDFYETPFFKYKKLDKTNIEGGTPVSVIIVGGNERMERLYCDVCTAHGCKAKVFTKVGGDVKRLLGKADLYIVFTNTVSHKLVQCAMSEARKCNACVERCHSSGLSSLKTILRSYCGRSSA